MNNKKKRGRKPKSKTVVNCGANFSVNPKNDNLIVTIPIHTSEKPENALKGYEDESWGSTIDETCHCPCCWNCAGNIENRVSLPLVYKYNVFYLYGSFCSFGCSSRYLFDNFSNKELWEKYSILNLYYNRINNTSGEDVPVNPSKLRLKKFGGDMTFEDYNQSGNCSNTSGIMILPIFPINHDVYDYDAKVKIQGKNELKLYRKKPVSNKNIFGTMNIS